MYCALFQEILPIQSMLVKNKHSSSQMYILEYILCMYPVCHTTYCVSFVRSWDLPNIKAIRKFLVPHIFVQIESLVGCRINVLWLYYKVTGVCMVVLTCMTLIIVLKNCILHIISAQYTNLLIVHYRLIIS